VKKREGVLCLAELLAIVLFAVGFGNGWLNDFLRYELPPCPDSGPVPDHCYSVPGRQLIHKETVLLGALG